MNLSSADVDMDYSDRGHKKGDFFCRSSRRSTYVEGYNWNDKYLPPIDKYLPPIDYQKRTKKRVRRPLPVINF